MKTGPGSKYPFVERLIRGLAVRSLDGAGVAELHRQNIDGQPLLTRRALLLDGTAVDDDWKAVETDWSVVDTLIAGSGGPSDVLSTADSVLLAHVEANGYETHATYDVPGRILTTTLPDDTEQQMTYSTRGILSRVEQRHHGIGNFEPVLASSTHNAKGQLLTETAGNGVVREYGYDPRTFRLIEDLVRRGVGKPLRKVRYTYDAAGQLVERFDEAIPVLHYNNTCIQPRWTYRYDPLGRLIEARGREHVGNSAPASVTPESGKLSPHRNDLLALRNYVQRYTYSPNGNIQQMRHCAPGGSWTRDYTYETSSNRLLTATVATTESYSYDVHGNMLSLPKLSKMVYGSTDAMVAVDLGGGGTASYQYDAGRERVRKRVVRLDNSVDERLYLGGYEVYRHYDSNGVLDRELETIHVPGISGRLAMVETRTVDVTAGAQGPRIRYQVGDHLQSVTMELNETARIISLEECHPYGTTAFEQTAEASEVAAKRYRYTGMERDEETGLSYHSARYYAPWLGRWCAADPIGAKGGLTAYWYADNSPIIHSDINGQETDKTDGTPGKDGGEGGVDGVGGGEAIMLDPIYINPDSGPNNGVENSFAGAGGVIKSILDGIGQVLEHPVDTVNGVAETIGPWLTWGNFGGFGGLDTQREKSLETLKGMVPFSQAEELWDRGEYGKALGSGAMEAALLFVPVFRGVKKPTGASPGAVPKAVPKPRPKPRPPIVAVGSIADLKATLKGLLPGSKPAGINGASVNNITAEAARRIQATANKAQKQIVLFGSRASGTADALSDCDYLLAGKNAKFRKRAHNEKLPKGSSRFDRDGNPTDGWDLVDIDDPFVSDTLLPGNPKMIIFTPRAP